MTQAVDIPVLTLQQTLAGRYDIVAPLGRGGMGEVFLAREIRLDRQVAIKVLPPARAALPAVRERFLREARTAAGLSHPHIIPIFAVDEAEPFVYYVMAYVSGGTLGDRVRSLGRLPPAAAARVLRETAWALAYAHARGVIHRDVKPDNILLDAETGRVIVTDFGIARVGPGGSGTTGPHQVIGTAEFMSPEQASGRPVDGRGDLYSLGAVGFYALTGRLPFVGHDDHAVLAQHISAAPPPLAVEAPWVPRRLAQIVERCLAKDPAARFPHGEDLADALARSGSDDPPIAVRAFLAEGRHLSTPALLYEIVLGTGVAPLLLLAWLSGGDPRLRVTMTALAVAGLAAPLAYMVRRVRRLRAAGHDRDELVEALEGHLARRREELAFVYGGRASAGELGLRLIIYGGLGVAALCAWSDPGVPGVLAGAPGLAAVSCAVAFLAAVAARARTEQRADPRGERRLRFWRGPLGRWLFRLAGGGPRAAAPSGSTSRPVTPPALA